jgi:hypothetical protein
MPMANKKRWGFGTWLCMFAVTILFLSGGFFAHNDAIAAQAADCHATLDGGSSHKETGDMPGECESDSVSQTLHCGAPILFISIISAVPCVGADDTLIAWPVTTMCGRSSALDPPPPRDRSALI